MKTIKIMMLTLLMLSINYSQTKMFINKQSGVDSILLSDIKSITFKTGTMGSLDSLVAYYPFNGNTKDMSASGLDITNMGATLTSDRFSNPNSAYNFDGNTAYMIIPDSLKKLTFDANSESYSLSMWVNLSAKPSRHIHFIMDRMDVGPWSYYLNFGVPSSIYYKPYDGGAGGGEFIADSSLSIGVWYHLVAVYSFKNVKLYLNGNLISSNVLPAGYGSTKRTTKNVLIGAFANSPTAIVDRMIGKIDDIRIYRKALTSNEIQSLYHEGGW
ncbi:MAG: LamG domain-containing protein [Bacteroidetes bacterium]|nr:LamG domain-containing protein [Bacteroidota bacterium]